MWLSKRYLNIHSLAYFNLSYLDYSDFAYCDNYEELLSKLFFFDIFLRELTEPDFWDLFSREFIWTWFTCSYYYYYSCCCWTIFYENNLFTSLIWIFTCAFQSPIDASIYTLLLNAAIVYKIPKSPSYDIFYCKPANYVKI